MCEKTLTIIKEGGGDYLIALKKNRKKKYKQAIQLLERGTEGALGLSNTKWDTIFIFEFEGGLEIISPQIKSPF